MALSGNTITRMLAASHLSATGLVAPPAKIAELFNDAITHYAPGVFNTPDRIAALLSECLVESAWFRTTTEYGNGTLSWQHAYAPYIGRTGIQLTWRSNYAAFGAWAKRKGLVSDAGVFVDHPQKLGDLEWFALGAIYYFTVPTFSGKPLYEYAGNIDQVGKAVNLGNPFSTATPNGAPQRRAAYQAIRPLGNALLPAPPLHREAFKVGRIALATSVAPARRAPAGAFVMQDGKRLAKLKGGKFAITALKRSTDGTVWAKGRTYWYNTKHLACYGS